ncbi:MAG: site-specific integrase [Oscillospiraceae bacterium]|nr:site-specific integrase [Oscillospiraceae bacterium]
MKRKANGSGSIVRLSNGKWHAKLMMGYRPDGKKNIICFTADTKGEVQQMVRNYQQEQAENMDTKKSVSFAEWANTWYQDYQTEVQPSTYSNYKYTLSTLINYFGERQLCDIKQIDINRFLDALTEQGYSRSKVSKCKAMLIQIFNAGIANDLVDKNPAAVAKAKRKLAQADEEDIGSKDAFTEAEVQLMIDHLQDNLLGNSILLMIGSGMRTQELLALTKGDIASDGSSVHITKAIEMVDGQPKLGPPKSKRSRRTIPIPSNYRFFAKRVRELGGSKYVWESSRGNSLYSVGTFRRQYYAALKQIPGIRLLSPHCCRHTYVTRLQERGISIDLVARLAGHSRISTTDNYIHTSIDTLAAAVDVLNAANAAGGVS